MWEENEHLLIYKNNTEKNKKNNEIKSKDRRGAERPKVPGVLGAERVVGPKEAEGRLGAPLPRSPRIVGFDLDSTLIRTKSGKKYAVSANDWEYNYPVVQDKVRKLPEDIYVVIVSNQKGLKSKTQIETYKSKIENLDFGREFTLYAALTDVYRKPSSHIFEKYIEPTNLKSFMFVGDAAGRPDDFADSDRMFAENIRMRFPNVNVYFRTPEQFFNITTKAPQEITPVAKFNPSVYLDLPPFDSSPIIETIKNSPTLVIMVGPPASGKSTFAKNLSYKTGSDILNNDSQTAKVVQKRFDEIVKSGKLSRSVIIDNTNPDDASRNKFISKVTSGPILILVMPQDRELSKHLYHCRVRRTFVTIPDVAFNVYYKKYSRPQPTNRIRVIDIPFTPSFSSQSSKLDFLEQY